jgi:hypothetical protein
VSIDSHFREHDPILDANHCERCNAALRHTLVLLADLDFGPKDAMTLAKKIREIALGLDESRNYVFDFARPTIENVVAPEFGEIDADIDIPLPPR